MKRRYYITPSRLDNMTVRKNGKVTRTLKGGELYTGIEAVNYPRAKDSWASGFAEERPFKRLVLTPSPPV